VTWVVAIGWRSLAGNASDVLFRHADDTLQRICRVTGQ
jgi:hypothetical protein